MTNLERAQFAANLLFTAGNGETAEQLALIAPDGRKLGALNIDAVVTLLHRVLNEATDTTPLSAFVLSAEQLRDIMPNLTGAKLSAYRPCLNAAMAEYEINTPLRASAFLAQIAHESGEFRYMEELWGKNGGTAQQKRYEMPSSLAHTLGNTQPGDGYRYRGRGVIMITGRSNYRKYGQLLGVDLEGNPDLAAKPEYAFRLAGAYWKTHGLNELADARDFKQITIRINGGTTNLADREKYYERARKVLRI